MDWRLALQVLTLLVAAIGPVVAYRYAKRLAISANRQAWLDALRADVAELIALADAVTTITRQIHLSDDRKTAFEMGHVLREKAAELQIVRYRIRLRLRAGNPAHQALNAAIEQLVSPEGRESERRGELREAVVEAAQAILISVWRRIERGG